ncbi:MAG: hypothetical protein M0R46_01550 [Candidatus Muirbacterium halophilum]|nr:hypothetical protein [Candidatus Muirbacterium halophilum]
MIDEIKEYLEYEAALGDYSKRFIINYFMDLDYKNWSVEFNSEDSKIFIYDKVNTDMNIDISEKEFINELISKYGINVKIFKEDRIEPVTVITWVVASVVVTYGSCAIVKKITKTIKEVIKTIKTKDDADSTCYEKQKISVKLGIFEYNCNIIETTTLKNTKTGKTKKEIVNKTEKKVEETEPYEVINVLNEYCVPKNIHQEKPDDSEQPEPNEPKPEQSNQKPSDSWGQELPPWYNN